jgi:hypothetical protein
MSLADAVRMLRDDLLSRDTGCARLSPYGMRRDLAWKKLTKL